MNIYDAAKILSLSGELLPQDTKAAYRTACKKYHPDINPVGEDMMKIINEAYDALKDYSGEIKSEQTDYGDLLNDALNAVSNLPALVIEICGSWVWLTGETRQYIGVSIDRPAKDIAADIMRRLMSHYLKSYEAALLRYQENQEKENQIALIAQSIVKVTGGRISDHSRARKTIYFENGEAEIWSSGDMTLNLNRLSIKQAIQIVSMLREDEP